jgi:hypothetical protein
MLPGRMECVDLLGSTRSATPVGVPSRLANIAIPKSATATSCSFSASCGRTPKTLYEFCFHVIGSTVTGVDISRPDRKFQLLIVSATASKSSVGTSPGAEMSMISVTDG